MNKKVIMIGAKNWK